MANEWLPPWDQHTADLRANDGLERKCITPEERAVIEAAKAWASVRPRMKSEIPFTYSNNLFKAVDALCKAARATALADELRRLVEARMPTVEHLQEHFCFYDGHGQQSAINDARAYIRDRLLGTDAAEGGEADD